jgi:hypothetical protein
MKLQLCFLDFSKDKPRDKGEGHDPEKVAPKADGSRDITPRAIVQKLDPNENGLIKAECEPDGESRGEGEFDMGAHSTRVDGVSRDCYVRQGWRVGHF